MALSVTISAELKPLNAALAEADRMTKAFGNTSVASFNMVERAMAGTNAATARMIKGFADTDTRARAAGAGVKLTSNQVQNLGYQLNDIGTMLSMGMSPFAIITSQSGQVLQVLQDGPGGVRGSIKAIGTSLLALATPVNLTIAGLAAAGAAGIYFATRTSEKIKPLNEAMEAHKRALDAVAASYGLAMQKADAYQRASMDLAAFRERRTRAELELSARKSLTDAFSPSLTNFEFITPAVMGRPVKAAEEYRIFEEQLLRLNGQMEKGKGDAIAFVDEVSRIANLDPANKELQELAAKLVEAAAPAADAQRQMQALALSIDRVTAAAQRAYRAGRSDLGGMVPDLTTDREKIERGYQQQINRADRLGRTPRAVEGILLDADRQRKAALDEITRLEDVARQGRELDIRAVFARTAAEQALIAAEREHLALSGEVMEASERAARIDAARALVLAEAIRSADDTLRSARNTESIAGLSGYAAQLEQLNQQYAQQIEAANGAAEAVSRLQEAREREIRALNINTTRSLFGPQEDTLRRLQAEASTIGASTEQHRRVMAALQAENDLRRAGIDLNSEMGRSYLANAAALTEYETAIERHKDAWNEVRRAGETAIDTLVDGLVEGTDSFSDILKNVGRDLLSDALEMGVKNPLKNLLGGNHPTFSDLFAGAGAAPSLALPTLGASVATPMYVSVVNAGGALGAIGSLLGGAPASNNGRPTTGNAFLDLIGRAEGTDRGRGYNETLGYGAFTNGDRNLVTMTLNQVQALQRQMLAHPANNFNSSAVGRYQITGRTMRGLMGEMGLSGNELYSPQMQDRMALQLASRRGNNVGGLRNEWEGLRRIDPTTITDAYGSLQTASTGLAESATAFTQDFSGITGSMNAALGGIVDKFIPGFGGVLTQLLDALSQGQGGGFLSSLFGGGGGGKISAGAFAHIASGGTGGLYANGGIATRASIFGEAGPEAAVPLPDGRSIPVTLRMPRYASQGMARMQSGGGRQVIDIRLRDDSGRMMEVAEQVVETRAGDIIRISRKESMKAVRQELPGMVRDNQRRSRG